MRNRILFSLMGLMLVGATGTRATSSGAIGGSQQAMTYLSEPTLIGSTIVQGPVLFTHDESKMERGEACTTVYLIEPGKKRGEEIASFHCIPTRRALVGKFTITTRPNDALGFGCVLTEYQFAGDAEGHGVPLPTLVSVRALSARGGSD
jgi:hypothetical protein